ncbi:hypothetical protein EVA_08684 [gut metagenome]|uniref:Uncharacterized protein n=1 Tax=gut metagenome TaxID=749906 RepID=J9GSJ4_9ZZZZ
MQTPKTGKWTVDSFIQHLQFACKSTPNSEYFDTKPLFIAIPIYFFRYFAPEKEKS